MKHTFMQIRIVGAVLGAALLASVPVRAATQETSSVGGALTVVPGKAGAAPSVPSADTKSVKESSSTLLGTIPSLQAPSPSFGAEQVGGTGLGAPGNGLILRRTKQENEVPPKTSDYGIGK